MEKDGLKKLILKSIDFFKTVALVVIIMATYQETKVVIKDLPLPCSIERSVDKNKVAIENSLKYLGYTVSDKREVVDGLATGAKRIEASPVTSRVIEKPSQFVTALAHTESRMSLNARSHKGYSSILQTPGKETTRKYADVDVLHGVRILEEKLSDPKSKGELRTALAMYKGGLNKTAFKQADEVLALYSKLKHNITV